MKFVYLILKILLALLLISGGFNHFYKPEFYNGFIPEFLPKLPVNYISGIIELLLGFGLFIKGFEKKAAFGIFVLMIFFLPIHIWDALKETPAIGSKKAAYIRIGVQLIFIAWTWYIFQKENKTSLQSTN